jgi:hypothetical protein
MRKRPSISDGGCRGDFGAKVRPIADGRGLSPAASRPARQAHESNRLEPMRLAGDKRCSYRSVRRYLRRPGFVAVSPT